MEPKLIYDLFDSPLGPLGMVSSPEGLCFVLWRVTEAELIEQVRAETGLIPRKDSRKLSPWRRRFARYFLGEKIAFDAPISFLVGTPFQKKVWRKMSEIPYGEVRSYQWLADRLGMGEGARAVGNACGNNPLPIVVPCHRVVRRNGSLGGYTGGLEIKKRLLAIESKSAGRGGVGRHFFLAAQAPTY